MREKLSNENINCQKSVKNINNRRKMHQNRKKNSKTIKNSLKKNIKNDRKRIKKRQKYV